MKLVGIARQASESTILAAKRRVEYRTLPTKKWLNRCHSTRVPFDWTINPYRGCEYGCKYCYARFTHEYLERLDPLSFETEIFAKDWSSASFTQELRSVKAGQVIGLGTATDPYQPAERKFLRTAGVLSALMSLRDVSIWITTKSDLVERDVQAIADLSTHNDVRVSITITTLDRELARQMEPFAPRPDLRLQAVRALAAAGIRVGVLASPVLPLLTDSEANLRAIAAAAADAGAKSFSAGVLFLKPEAQRVFFPFLESSYPKLLGRYQSNYRSGAFLKGDYPGRISRLVEAIRLELIPKSGHFPFIRPPVPEGAQLKLF